MISAYYLKARLFPTVLTSIPLLVFINGIVLKYFSESLNDILFIMPYITSIGISSALIFLFVQINRIISKQIFQTLYFQDELKMPSTNHLLWFNPYFDKAIKRQIRDKIQEKYSITLAPPDQEKNNEAFSRRQIAIAVSQIRNSLRDNKLLLQHNIEYGFFRNLIGGCVVAIMFSLVILFYGVYINNPSLKVAGIILSIIYVIPIILSKYIITFYGKNYSKILYEQFLSL